MPWKKLLLNSVKLNNAQNEYDICIDVNRFNKLCGHLSFLGVPHAAQILVFGKKKTFDKTIYSTFLDQSDCAYKTATYRSHFSHCFLKAQLILWSRACFKSKPQTIVNVYSHVERFSVNFLLLLN